MSEAAPKSGEFADGKLWFVRKGTTLTLGLTNSAIEELGALESIELPDEGEDFDKGETVVTVDGTHGSLEITTPAAGIVDAVNKAAQSEPEMVTEDPLEEGWLIKIEIQDTTDLKELVSG